MMHCKISVLTDNLAGASGKAEHGLSLLIEADKTILFDAGASDIFLQNARSIKVYPQKCELAVLSHGHWDHGNGFIHLPGIKILCHPGVFQRRFRRNNNVHIGLSYTKADAERLFQMQYVDKPFQISEQVFCLGQIPRQTAFESVKTKYVFEDGNDDFVDDETALAVKTDKGIVVIAGCSHSGICNIVQQAVKVTGVDKVNAVIGGFHLKAANDTTRKTIDFLQQAGVEKVYPMHCTSFAAACQFNRTFGSTRLHTCTKIVF